MRIGEAASAAGLPVKTVRYYADIGLIEPSARAENGYREYSNDDIKRLAFVRRSRSFGFSVPECRDLLALYADDNRSAGDVKQLAEERLKDIEAKQAELAALHDTLSTLVHACQGGDRPHCPIIDHLA